MAARHNERSKSKPSGSGGGGRPDKNGDIVCYNCQKKGHTRADCWGEGGGKAGQGPKRDRSRDNRSGTKQSGRAKKSEGEKTGGGEDYAFAVKPTGTAFRTAATGNSVIRLLDSAASQHYDPDKGNFEFLRAVKPYSIEVANGKIYEATQMGDVVFECDSNGTTKTFRLHDVYYTPWMSDPLISISRLRKSGATFSNATEGYGDIRRADGTLILRSKEEYGVYPIKTWQSWRRIQYSAISRPKQ